MKALARYHDWQLRLEAFARERQSMPFAWGINDCCTFAADWVEQATGVRMLSNMRGYRTARDALVLIKGGGGLRSIACHALGGFILPAYARVGDVVLHKYGKREALGVCNGGGILAPAMQGMVCVGMDDALTAWRVG